MLEEIKLIEHYPTVHVDFDGDEISCQTIITSHCDEFAEFIDQIPEILLGNKIIGEEVFVSNFKPIDILNYLIEGNIGAGGRMDITSKHQFESLRKELLRMVDIIDKIEFGR